MPIILADIAYVGWFGVTVKEPVVAEACRDSDQRHAVYPQLVGMPAANAVRG